MRRTNSSVLEEEGAYPYPDHPDHPDHPDQPHPPQWVPFRESTSPVALVLGLLFVACIILILGTAANHGRRRRPPLGVQVAAVWVCVAVAGTGLLYEMFDCKRLLCGSGYSFGQPTGTCLDAVGLALLCAAVFTVSRSCSNPNPNPNPNANLQNEAEPGPNPTRNRIRWTVAAPAVRRARCSRAASTGRP